MHTPGGQGTNKRTRPVHEDVYGVAGAFGHRRLNEFDSGTDRYRAQGDRPYPAPRAGTAEQQQHEQKPAGGKHDDIRELFDARIGDKPGQPALGVTGIEKRSQTRARLVIVHMLRGEHDCCNGSAIQGKKRPSDYPEHSARSTRQDDPAHRTPCSHQRQKAP